MLRLAGGCPISLAEVSELCVGHWSLILLYTCCKGTPLGSDEDVITSLQHLFTGQHRQFIPSCGGSRSLRFQKLSNANPDCSLALRELAKFCKVLTAKSWGCTSLSSYDPGFYTVRVARASSLASLQQKRHQEDRTVPDTSTKILQAIEVRGWGFGLLPRH